MAIPSDVKRTYPKAALDALAIHEFKRFLDKELSLTTIGKDFQSDRVPHVPGMSHAWACLTLVDHQLNTEEEAHSKPSCGRSGVRSSMSMSTMVVLELVCWRALYALFSQHATAKKHAQLNTTVGMTMLRGFRGIGATAASDNPRTTEVPLDASAWPKSPCSC